MPSGSCRSKTTELLAGALLWCAALLAFGHPAPALGAPGGSDRGASGRGEVRPSADDSPRRYPIRRVFVEGNKRTDRDVIIRELVFEPGDAVTRDQIEESVQRLLNVGVFDEVDYELVRVADTEPDPAYFLVLTLEERWTIIPVANGSFGGDLLQLQLGVFDINLLGRFLRAGVQYRRLGDTNSFSVWFRDPRFLGKRLMLGGSVSRSARIRVLYDEDGEAEGGYLRERWSTGLSIQREWLWWLRTSAGLGFHTDAFSLKFLGDELAELQRQRGLPEQHAAMSASASVRVGRVDSKSFLRDGAVGALSVGYTPPLGFGEQDLHFLNLGIGGSVYETLPLDANAVMTLSAGLTTTDAIEHQYFLGGLGSLRGYVDSRFRGSRYWLANAEFRIPSINTDWVVLQHVVFADVGNAGDTFRTYGDVSGLSVGVGFRLISPKIYNFVARVDWAFPLIGDGRSPLSLGSGQFL